MIEGDILTSRPFDDAIAFGGWSLDLHPPEGIDAPDQQPCVQTPVPWLYDIPLSCCVSRDVVNLMFAGRNLSATHVAFSSTRVMATCAVVGQGVGTAAAHAVEHNIEICDLPRNAPAMQAIQQQLLYDDCFLIGQTHSSACDIATTATISASSESPEGPSIHVISGVTRSVHGARGAPRERCIAGTHRWMSDSTAGLPAWIQLEWSDLITVRGIQLIFDTGLHRHLTLSHHDGYTNRMLWGQPQPETVRDYSVSTCRDDDRWETFVEIHDNYQRLRRHRFASEKLIRKLRVEVTRTNGLDHARIVEIRVEGTRGSG